MTGIVLKIQEGDISRREREREREKFECLF